MASFSLLPAELVEFILAYLAQPQLYAICRLNKGFHALALPYLYRNVDLVIPPGDRVPRIDWFCLNIIKSRKLAAKVESLRLGTSPFEQVKTSQRWLRQDDHFDNKLLINVAQTILDNETLVSKNDYLVDAVSLREYGAYAALLILQLPRLQRLSIADFDSASLEYVHNILRNLHPGTDWNQRHASKELVQRLTFIRHAYVNVDPITGLAHPASAGSLTIDPILNLSNVQELELCIPYPAQSANPATHRRVQEPRLVKNQKPTSITKLVVRHTARTQQSLLRLLDCSPQLRSFTYDFFCDHKDLQNEQAQVIDLSYWSDHLPRTLEIMVFSVEYCDTSKYFFRQPRIGERLIGFLDLTYYTNLRTLEVPVPFLTGDPESSLSTEIYPLLPPNLVHLSLRTDLLHSQFAFPMDMSILPTGCTCPFLSHGASPL